MPINDRAKCNCAISADLLIEIEGKVQEHSWFLIFSPLSHHDAAADGSPALRFARDGYRAREILRPRSFRGAIFLERLKESEKRKLVRVLLKEHGRTFADEPRIKSKKTDAVSAFRWLCARHSSGSPARQNGNGRGSRSARQSRRNRGYPILFSHAEWRAVSE